ncbi:MAG: hypothetical protein Q8P67_12980, partial [archaeon]|nr:hypothetical protein [archaeon]
SGWVVREGGPHVGTNTPLAESPIIPTKLVGGSTAQDPPQKVLWVIPLDSELQYPEASEILNFDEKPLIPDSIRLVRVGEAIAYGRTNSWSVVLFLTSEGTVVAYTLILRGQSVEASIAARTMVEGGAVTATPKGYQTDQTLLNDITRILEGKLINRRANAPFIFSLWAWKSPPAISLAPSLSKQRFLHPLDRNSCHCSCISLITSSDGRRRILDYCESQLIPESSSQTTNSTRNSSETFGKEKFS